MKQKFTGKKGFEIQFNWIFVLIAGTAILLFFGAIVMKQKSISDSSKDGEIIRGIDAVVTSAGITSDTTNLIEIPESEIGVSCTHFSSGKVTKQHYNLLLFSPSVIKGNKIITQTTPFGMPYRSSALLYSTGTKLKYIMIGKTDIMREINRTLPREIDYRIIDSYPSTMPNPNTYRVRFIVTDSTNLQSTSVPDSIKGMDDEEVSAVKITGDVNKGNIEFYQKKGSSWALQTKYPFSGKAAMIAAVYADTKELYECSMKKAFLKHNLVTQILIDRTSRLRSDSARIQCVKIYDNALQHLNSILQFSGILSSSIDSINMQRLSDSSEKLSVENKEAQKLSCPLVY